MRRTARSGLWLLGLVVACSGAEDPPGLPDLGSAGDVGTPDQGTDAGGGGDTGAPVDLGGSEPDGGLDLGVFEPDGGVGADGGGSGGDVGVTPAPLYFPPTTGDTWETIDPATAGWDVTKLEEALAYAESKDSTGVLVLQSGRIVVERYWQGWDLHTSEGIFSASKSVTSILVGMLLEDGALTLDDPVALHLGPGWTTAPADKEALITVRHLLTMTSGLNDNLGYVADAGTRWSYNTNAYHQLFGVIAAAAGMSRDDFAQARLHDPIGMQDAAWRPQRLNASTRDMARFGLLVLANGIWDGTPILTHPTYLSEALASSQTLNPSYGYLWWLNGKSDFLLPGPNPMLQAGPLMPDAPADLVAALGAGDKKIYVVPSRGLVVARHGGPTGDPALAASSFDNLFWQKLIAAAPPP